jgi:protein-S-isoprenylcysteine O-methyltransferase Ste14
MTRHPLLTILMAVVGVILLLPGVCAAGFLVLGGLRNPDPSIIGLWLVCFMIAAGGALLLYMAFRKPADTNT